MVDGPTGVDGLTGVDGPVVGVRLATPADAGALVEIYGPHCAVGHASFEVAAPSVAEMAERVRAVLAFYPWLVAVDDHDEVVGYAYASRHRDRAGYRWSVDVAVYVASAAAGRGVGRLLYERLLPLLSAQGFHRAYAGIALPNDASVALHRRVGFEPIGTYREVGFKHGAWLDVQWWSRSIADLPFPPPEPIALSSVVTDVVGERLVAERFKD